MHHLTKFTNYSAFIANNLKLGQFAFAIATRSTLETKLNWQKKSFSRGVYVSHRILSRCLRSHSSFLTALNCTQHTAERVCFPHYDSLTSLEKIIEMSGRTVRLKNRLEDFSASLDLWAKARFSSFGWIYYQSARRNSLAYGPVGFLSALAIISSPKMNGCERNFLATHELERPDEKMWFRSQITDSIRHKASYEICSEAIREAKLN